MNDIKAGKTDTVVFYKADRLTRSLPDFTKLVEVFDRNRVSFVLVSQQFNTTTSIGRLTLNTVIPAMCSAPPVRRRRVRRTAG